MYSSATQYKYAIFLRQTPTENLKCQYPLKKLMFVRMLDAFAVAAFDPILTFQI